MDIFSDDGLEKLITLIKGTIDNINNAIANKMDKVTLATVATSGKYKDLSDKPFIIVSKDGKGDFTTLTDAFNSIPNGGEIRILLKEGDYEESCNVAGRFSNVVIIGTNKQKCRLINQTGVYKNCPLVINGNFTLANLSFVMTLDKKGSWMPTYNDADVQNTYPAYALHIDGNSYDSSKTTFGNVTNCYIYSTASCAVGMGTNQSQHIEISDCEIVRSKTNGFTRDNWQGALMCHASNTASHIDQYFSLVRNTFMALTGLGYSCYIRGDLAGSSNFIFNAVDNHFISMNAGNSDFDSEYNGKCLYDKGNSILYYESRGNDSSNLNIYDRTVSNAEKVNNHSVDSDVPSNAKFTDTTYSSKSAASGGTDVSLVTTGEKYTWNNKLSGTVAIANGGTGATTKENARSNLGLGGASTYSATSSVTSGSSALVTSGGVYSAINNVGKTLTSLLSHSGRSGASASSLKNVSDLATNYSFVYVTFCYSYNGKQKFATAIIPTSILSNNGSSISNGDHFIAGLNLGNDWCYTRVHITRTYVRVAEIQTSTSWSSLTFVTDIYAIK